MERKAIERILSTERLDPYLQHHDNDFDKAIKHYKTNIEISEAFYPLLSILEIGLRNNIDIQLSRMFKDENWFEKTEFVKIISRFQIDKISEARSSILREKKTITSGRIISELSFGFWTSLLDSKFERTLWKNLRHSFPNCPKALRQRKAMSSKFNGVRKLRNRIFHHEPITWSFKAINNYRTSMIEGIDWLDKGLLEWSNDLNRLNHILEERKPIIK